MKNNPLPRLDASQETREALLPFCRLKPGEVWEDSRAGHRVGCLDASALDQVEYLMDGRKATLAMLYDGHRPVRCFAKFRFAGWNIFEKPAARVGKTAIRLKTNTYAPAKTHGNA